MTLRLIIIGLAVASVAAPAQARMSHVLPFGDDLLGGGAVQQMADPAGALFQQMFRDFANAPERLPKTGPRNDMDATLDAMEQAKIGFGEGRPARTSRRGRKARPRS